SRASPPTRPLTSSPTRRSSDLVPTVGGGVSQFATTLFNAAFFAGFDFLDYQSHSIYFSRYPYGREATISWPAPDLKIQNTTDYRLEEHTSELQSRENLVCRLLL